MKLEGQPNKQPMIMREILRVRRIGREVNRCFMRLLVRSQIRRWSGGRGVWSWCGAASRAWREGLEVKVEVEVEVGRSRAERRVRMEGWRWNGV